MYLSLRKRTTSVIAAFTVGIVTLSLVGVPPRVDAAITHRVQVHAVHLSAVATSEVTNTPVNTASTVVLALRGASTPRGAATTRPSARALIHPAAPPIHAAAATTAAAGVDVLGWLRDLVVTVGGLVGAELFVWAFAGAFVVWAVAGLIWCSIVRMAKGCGTADAQAITTTASAVAVQPKPAAGSGIHGRRFAVPAAVGNAKTTLGKPISVPTPLPTKKLLTIAAAASAKPLANRDRLRSDSHLHRGTGH
ncbi:hypothetical protein CIW47_12550 [Mycolicibacterium sp. P1-5]|nr:hypothetical protein CIW47_12550 [Mycolicibacterium sp. P1-5]